MWVAIKAAGGLLGMLLAGAAGAGPAPAGGRQPLEGLLARYERLTSDHGWEAETVYAYPEDPGLVIRAWHTKRRGEALWLLAGIHGEEPAGPNAIAAQLETIAALAESGVPMVVIPLCNPKGYRNVWRYPNTAERDWRKGGYSVGDSEYLLPDTGEGKTPRAPAPPGPETRALTGFALRLAASYPPRLAIDLHEDELSTEGGYIYSQGVKAKGNPVGAEVIRLLAAAGIPLRLSGMTRFGEPIVDGVISRDAEGRPLRDGSIDELLAAPVVFEGGAGQRGPSGRTVIVVETPAFAGARLALRIAAQGAVVRSLGELWRLAGTVKGGP